MGGAAPPSNAPVMPQRLQHLEINALVKQQLPRETQNSGGTTSPSTNAKDLEAAQYDGTGEETTTGHDLTSSSALTAEIVDEAEERDKIAKSIISTAVVATRVDEHAEKRQTRKLFGLVACALLILTAVVLGGVCGTGNCSKGPSAAERAEALTKFIASVTTTSSSSSSSTPLVYPYTGDAATRSPEQEALIHLIEDDPLKLSVVANGDVAANWRLVQRYALLIIWFTNGPFTEPVDEQDVGGDRSAASAEWLVGSHECGWLGIDCDDGRVVQLSLIHRGLTGTVPGAMGLLTDLVGLRLSDELEGSLEDVIGTLAGGTTRLITLELSGCLFGGTLPGEQLAEFVSLKTLELTGNRLTGTIPESIGTMTMLESLDLSFNEGITGTIQTSLAGLTSLTKLGLSNFDPSGSTAFDFLSEMKDLTHLHLDPITTTASEGQLPSWVPLSGFSKLTHLSLYDVPLLEGTIPADVANWWPNMENLVLIDCNVTGTIPAALAQWTQLQALDLTLNQLTGSIPLASYAAWSDTLTIFLVPFNQMSGSLSSEIGLWSNLKFLGLNGNQFTGSLPTTIGLLTNANPVLFAQNRFTGTIPTEVNNFKWTAIVSYQDNEFTGTAPFCVDEKLVQHTVDCNEVVCTCCTGCQR
jgi:Leucine-rich repeat (LRR) protein